MRLSEKPEANCGSQRTPRRAAALALAALLLPLTVGVARGQVTNGGFEDAALAGWTTNAVPAYWARYASGQFYYPGFFTPTATDGSFVAANPWDAPAPVTATLAQTVALPAGASQLRFNWRAAWDLTVGNPLATQSRVFRLTVQPAGGGATLLTTNILTAAPNTKVTDSGATSAAVDLSAYAGSNVLLTFEAVSPEAMKGPGFIQLDSVSITNLGTPPSITGFSTHRADIGAAITITGTGFRTNAAENYVFFGGVRATVTSASSSSLSVIVPVGATFDLVRLGNPDGYVVESSVPFLPTFSPTSGAISAGSFTARQDISIGSQPYTFFFGDIDGDGKLDLAVARHSTQQVVFFRNTSTTGAISFAAAGSVSVGGSGNSAYYPVLADLDGDGKLDLAVVHYVAEYVSIFRNQSTVGSITFGTRADLATGPAPQGMSVGDLDRDGKLDIAVVNSGNATMSVFRNVSSPGSLTTSSFAARQNFVVGSGCRCLALGDLDGDGFLDVLTGNSAGVSSTMSVLRNNTAGGGISFEPAVSFAVSSDPNSIAVGDLDGDGKQDVVLALVGSGVIIYRNQATLGAFNTASLAPSFSLFTGDSVSDVELADLNGDGKLDIVDTVSSLGKIGIYENRATPGSLASGSFSPAVLLAFDPTYPFHVRAADLDGDGRPDVLATWDQNSGFAAIYRSLPPQSPSIVVQPANQNAFATSNVTFNVTATGDAPTYQWHSNGVSIAGATSSSLLLTNAQVAWSGSQYSVVITNTLGSVTSSVATLTVELFGKPRITATGSISGGTNTFGDSASVTMTTAFTNASLYYSLDGSAPFIGGPLTYSGAFTVTTNTTVRVLAVNLNDFSSVPSDPVSITIIPTYALTLTTAGGGTVAKSPSAASYLSNSVVTVTAVPDAGWSFLYWTGDTNGFTGGTAGAAGATNALTLNRARSVQAVFGTTLATSVVGSGTVQLSPTNGPYAYGSVVRLTPKPAVGHYFSLWGNAASGSANPLDFTVTQPGRTVSALFTALGAGQVNLYVDVVGNGSVTRSPSLNVYSSGQTVTLTAVTPLSSLFAGWSGDSVATTNVISLVLDANKSVTANFSPVPAGTVVSWGGTSFGQQNLPAGLSGVIAIAAGGYHTLALKNDGTVTAWGHNSSGQTLIPAGLNGVAAVAAGGGHSLALKSDGTVVAWGLNDFGQTTVPPGLGGVTAIAGSGGYFTLALKSDGTVVAWGDNRQGQTNVPAGLTGVTAIAAGNDHSVALKSDGTVVAWGKNSAGQANIPASLGLVTAIAASADQTLALRSDGTVVGWGANNYGQLNIPAGLSGVTNIAAGGVFSMALKGDGTVVAWGNNDEGQVSVPAGLSGVTAISAGAYHAVALVGNANGPVPPSILTQPLSQTVTAGSNVTFNVAAAGSSPFSYQWRSNTVSIANATNASLTLTNVQTSFAASYSVVITNAYGATTSSPAVLTVLLGQSITFGTLPNRTAVDAPFAVTASASSSLPVTLSVVSGPASVSGNTVTLLGTGSVTLRATQAGDATYAPASPVDQTFTIVKADQTITFAALPDRPLGDPPFSLSATASSGLTVSFSLVSGPASLSGSTLAMTNGGVVTVRAAQAGNTNFNGAPNVDRSFTVFTNPPPAVTLTSPAHRQSFKLGVPVALSASAVDPQAEAVTNLTVFANNAPVGSAGSGSFTGSWTPPSAGLYTLRAEARDSAGVLGVSAETEVRVQSLPPSVNLLSPANGTIFSLPTNVVLQAFAQDTDGFTNLVALVEFLDFGTNVIGSVAGPTNTTVAFTWTNPPPGQHSLTARATDAAGYPEESSARTITVTYPTNSVAVFSFGQPSYTVAEGAGSVTLVVVKNPSPAAAVNYTTADGTARAQDGNTLGDYTRQSGALSFGDGQLSSNIVVSIVNDSGYEGDQSFTVTLSSTDPNVIVTNPAVATVIIVDDDPAPTTNSVTTVLNPPALPGLGGLGSLTVSTLCTNLAGVASTNVGQWRLAWDTVWRNSGDTLSRLQPGNYDLVFQPRDGFTTPPGQTVPVSAGGAASPVAYYGATGPLQLGHLRVRLTPGTAEWRLQGETAWRASETTVSNLVAGPYVIEFNDLAGYHRLPPVDTRVYPNHLGTPRYTFPANPATWNMNVVPYDRLVTVQSGEAHAFNGQLLGEGGYGTGTVVKKRVVLTAAHLVFDDRKLGFVTNVYWFHRRYAGEYEPRPQQPRGWYVFGGYDAQRAVERSPGVSQPESQIKDTAALFFFEDAGGGGQSGYLASDAGTNWLAVAADKQLTGYSLDFPAPLAGQRKLQQTPVFSGAFEQDVLRGAVRATSAFRSSGGNSGGAVCVKFNNVFYPAAVFLGGTGQSVVRLIDRDVVDLINRAEVTANTGDNNTSGGVPTDSGAGLPVPVGLGVGALAVRLPADVLVAGGGWRFVRPGGESDPFITDNTLTTNRIVGLSDNTLEFRAVAGFLTPGRFSAPVLTNATQVLTLVYATNLGNRIVPGAGAEEFRFEVSASSYGRYRVDGLVSLNGQQHLTNAPWVPLATNTLDASGRHVFTNFPGAPFQFFRTVYLTNQ